MNLIEMRRHLEAKDFEHITQSLAGVEQSVLTRLFHDDIEIWKNDNRLVLMKAYTSNHHFILSWQEDQWIISQLPVFRNNVYFLLLLDWNSPLFSDTLLEINWTVGSSLIEAPYGLSIITMDGNGKFKLFTQKITQSSESMLS